MLIFNRLIKHKVVTLQGFIKIFAENYMIINPAKLPLCWEKRGDRFYTYPKVFTLG